MNLTEYGLGWYRNKATWEAAINAALIRHEERFGCAAKVVTLPRGIDLPKIPGVKVEHGQVQPEHLWVGA
jgi:hypothetical protein